MNKTDLIKAVTVAAKEEISITKGQTEVVINRLVDVLTNAFVEGEDIRIAGLGAFSVKERAAKTIKNPQTGEPIEVPASKYVHFKQSSTLKNILNV